MSARGFATIVAAFGVIAALLFVPGYFAKREVTDDPSAKVIAQGYKLLEATVQGLKVDRKSTRDGGVARAGGGQAVFQCARATISGTPSGWVCIGLTADGRAGAAIWSAPEPNTDNAQFFVGNLEALTRPKT